MIAQINPITKWRDIMIPKKIRILIKTGQVLHPDVVQVAKDIRSAAACGMETYLIGVSDNTLYNLWEEFSEEASANCLNVDAATTKWFLKWLDE